jgi:hypothetical protein
VAEGWLRSMTNITHRNHYVSQASLRRWSKDGVNVWAYGVLVPHANVPLWKPRAISGIGYQHDLYTSSEAGREFDDFERWITKEYEQPALCPTDKLLSGGRMAVSDWRCIARFVAAQDMRTPASFLEFKKLYDEHAPKILDQLVEEFLRFRNAGLPPPESAPPPRDSRRRFACGQQPLQAQNRDSLKCRLTPLLASYGLQISVMLFRTVPLSSAIIVGASSRHMGTRNGL